MAHASRMAHVGVHIRTAYGLFVHRTFSLRGAAVRALSTEAKQPSQDPRAELKHIPLQGELRMEWDIPPLPQEEWELIKPLLPQKPAFDAHLPKRADIIKQIRSAYIKPQPWTPTSRRTGIVGMKIGMMRLFDDWGVPYPVTVVSVSSVRTAS